MPSTQQIKIIQTLFSVTGNRSNKHDIVSGFTGGRSISLKELTHNETKALIEHLQQLSVTNEHQTAINKMRGKILYFAHEMRMTKQNNKGKTVADVKRVDEWMLKYSYLHKKLDAYTLEELPKLVSQFENVYKHFLNNF